MVNFRLNKHKAKCVTRSIKMIKQLNNIKEIEKADKGAFYFLIVLVVIIVTLAIFKSEVIKLVMKITEGL